jgi:hypothetical protein
MLTAMKKAFRFLVPGWTNGRTFPPVPAPLEDQVQLPDFPNIRDWGDRPSIILKNSLENSFQQELATQAATNAGASDTLDVLVLSGGSDNGAFGAGILCGWTKRGDRPVFKVVTGFSTGALISFFAFLGPAYDDTLKEVFTTVSAKDIFKAKNIFSILTSESLADNRPLADMIAKYTNGKMLDEIAAEHVKGRRLFVSTTQLDSQRLVIWDLGAIAASGQAQAPALFRKILLASSALPGIFPPVYFKVQAGGQTYEELHVDGATGLEALTYEHAIQPLSTSLKADSNGKRLPRLFIIRNGQLRPEWQDVKSQVFSIMPVALVTMIKNQSVGDLYRLYHESQREGFDYNLAIIPDDFQVLKREKFDTAYMNKLFSLGYEMASRGYPWAKKPPRLGSRETRLNSL